MLSLGQRRRRNGPAESLRAGLAEAVAGIVDLQHEEGHAGMAGPLQHGQPVGGLFIGDIEAGAQRVDVVAGALGGGEKGAVGIMMAWAA